MVFHLARAGARKFTRTSLPNLSRLRKHLKFVLLCLLAAAVVWWFGRKLDWAAVRAALAESDWRLVAASIVCVCLTYLVRACRWRALLRPLAPRAGLSALFAATTVGFGAIFLVGRAGEALRPAFLPLRDRRVKPAASFVTIAVERIYDMAAIVVMFSANLLVLRAPDAATSATFARARQAGLILLLAAAAGIAGLVLFRRRSGAVIGWLESVSERRAGLLGRAGKLLSHMLEQLARSLGVLTDARSLAVTVGWTVLLWSLIAAANLFVYRAFGLSLGVSETVFVLGWSLVGSLVPTPGGAAGTFHLATAAGLLALGAVRSSEEAAAVSIVLHLVVFGAALPFGLYHVLRSDVSFANLRRLASTGGEAGQTGSDESVSAPPVAAGSVVKGERARAARAES